MKKILIILFTINLLYAEFKLVPSARPKSALDSIKRYSVRDFKNIPQDPAYYTKYIEPFSREEQLENDVDFNYKFFLPWDKSSFDEPSNYIIWPFKMLKKRDLYLGKNRPLSKKAANYWIKNFNYENFDTIRAYAITTEYANLRAMPTSYSVYGDPKKGNKGFPFDILQNSAIYPNTPLYISHYSMDGNWAYVHSPAALGWIKRAKIALVDSKFKDSFKTGKYGVAVRDNMLLQNGNKRVSLVKIGTIFPIKGNNLIVAVKDKNAKAKISKFKRPSLSLVATKPITFNAKNIAYIARQLKRDPYAWGGIAYGRDCSATTKDFFAPFGVFLHRNSADQAKDGKGVVNIKRPKGRSKKDAILAYAKPFRSLLYVPGHIGIYLGSYKNEPIIMHTYWGVRLNDYSKLPLAHTIITTTEPGKELRQLRRKSTMANTLQKIINF